ASRAGLKVIVQVYVDSAPEWVGQRYIDGRYAAQDGQPIPSQAAPGFCFDHPGVRNAVLGFFEEVAQHVRNSPAFYGWDLWSEPATLNWARVGYKAQPMFCYCPSSMERFRGWLRKKYGTLDKLNLAWHRTFTDWKQVEPPRFGTILTYTDFMDWRIYYGYKLAEDLKARNDAVKAIDPGHVTTSHAPNPSPLERTLADPYDPTDDFLMKDSVDYCGAQLDITAARLGDGLDECDYAWPGLLRGGTPERLRGCTARRSDPKSRRAICNCGLGVWFRAVRRPLTTMLSIR
ncbi:MAG TPA: beta-galactosidase, partial [Candidatus Dormibacteraeota bacterium]|nr:beta-galactosidase [Candidatus Dormibacteraeota bacterium]